MNIDREMVAAKIAIKNMDSDLRKAQSFIRAAAYTAKQAGLDQTAADLETPLKWLDTYTQDGGFLARFEEQIKE